MRIAVYGSRRQEAYLAHIESFFSALAAAGDEAVVHSKLYNYLLHFMPAALKAVTRVTDTPDFTADYAVSLGGDGSFLRTAAWVGNKEIPILGVNTGHLGYLSPLHVERLGDVPAMLRTGAFDVEGRSVVAVDCDAVTGWPYALNEVAVGKGDGASIIDIDAYIDGHLLADYRADGLLISTPTGSTAYNLSVGGPIVQPTAPVLVLAPIAAHSLSLRPLVVADSTRLRLEARGRSANYRVALDGRSYVVDMDSPIMLSTAPFKVYVLLPQGSDFATTLRTKLAWN